MEAKTRLAELAAEASHVVDSSCGQVEQASPTAAADIYRCRAGRLMGYLFLNVLDPIWREFPELEPAEMKADDGPMKAYELPEAAIEIGVRAVDQVKALLTQASDVVATLPAEDREYFLAGLREVEYELLSLERLVRPARPKQSDARGRPTRGCLPCLRCVRQLSVED